MSVNQQDILNKFASQGIKTGKLDADHNFDLDFDPNKPLGVLVDGSNLLHRIMYTNLFDLKTSTGIMSGLIYGFLKSLVALSSKVNRIDSIIVFWDKGESVFRKNIFPQYKYKDEKRDLERERRLTVYGFSREVLHNNLHIFGVPSVLIPGIEADDLIGYFTLFDNWEWLIWSEDRDLTQLVKENVRQFRPIHKKYYSHKNLIDSMNHPTITSQGTQVALTVQKAMWGDNSDKIPGIDGVGEKKGLSYAKQMIDMDFSLKQKRKLDVKVFDNLSVLKRNIKLVDIMWCVEENFEEIKGRVQDSLRDQSQLTSSKDSVEEFLKKYEIRTLSTGIKEFMRLNKNKFDFSKSPGKPTAVAKRLVEEFIRQVELA